MNTLNHSVIKLNYNFTNVQSITIACEKGDTDILSAFIKRNYEFDGVNNRVMLIGRFNGKYFEVFNDRGLKPTKLGVELENRDSLALVSGKILCGKFELSEVTYLKSEVIHFGNVASDLGFKILCNSVIARLEYDNCEVHGVYVIKEGLVFKMTDLPEFKRRGSVTILGRLSDLSSSFHVQVLEFI